MNLQTKSSTGFFDGPVVTVDSVGELEAAKMIADRRAVWTMQHPSPSPVETPIVEPAEPTASNPEGDRS